MTELKDARDAARWRYQQRKGFFVCGPCDTDGDFTGYSVGIEPKIPEGLHWRERAKYGGVNQWITGHGKTLKKAIDDAIAKEKEKTND